MVKTYHRRVFGGKDTPWIGIDQGKGALVDGSVRMSLNATYDEDVMKQRDGQAVEASSFYSGIHTGKNTGTAVVFGSGVEVFAEEIE